MTLREKKYLAFMIIAIGTIISYNVFLASRDVQLFKSHDVENFCSSQAHWHPDCNH